MGGRICKGSCVAPNVCGLKKKEEKGNGVEEEILRDVLEVGVKLLSERRTVLWIDGEREKKRT